MNADRRILLHFVTKYFTDWGQNVVVSGAGALFGNYDLKRAHWATCHHAGKELVWDVIVPIPLVPEITYRYAVVDDTLNLIKWEEVIHTISLPQGLEDGAIVDIHDEWMDSSHPAHLLSSCAFTQVILADKPDVVPKVTESIKPTPNESIIRFQVRDWELQGNQEMCVSGAAPQLGNWQLHHVLKMTQTSASCWEAEVSVPLNVFPVTYKYGVEERGGGGLTLEHGESRLVTLPMSESSRSPTMVVQNDGYFRRERRWRGAGVAVPVFSLRSGKSVGCGEFADLPAMVDWCASAGLKMLQILPVSDTSVRGTWQDSYPYSSICVFALHPMYLCISKLTDQLPPGVDQEIEAVRAKLDLLPDVDYEATMAAKLRISRKIFNATGQQTLQNPEFESFAKANEEWLQPYAIFCFLKEFFGTAEYWRWGAFSNPTKEALRKLAEPDREWHATVQYHMYLQYHLHRQLAAASAYAGASGVALKGDLPIGVDKRSVDTWLAPRQFRMDASTGAPPDYFDANGQNWGFPTYNWEEMEADGYSWWRRRLAHMEQYFHAYRIDHILGFFRIWELPSDTKLGLLGRFRPSVPLYRHELESRGIWDFDRLCEPYITPALLDRTFGALASEIADRYFVEGSGRRLKFRDQYASEKALDKLRARAGLPEELVNEMEVTRKGLLALRQNVVLLRDPDDPQQRFYPRINLASTSSFKDLDLHWREELSHLHDDYFYAGRNDSVWREHALRTLPILQESSDMLVCGEDLGMIPGCVHPIMKELGIVGLRIQRMPSETGQEFGDPAMYPYMTIASPSSHDTSTTRAWYEADDDRKERFFVHGLGVEEESAPERCTPAVAAAVVQQHLHSPSVLAIFPLQDLMALSETLTTRPAEEEIINDPTNSEHYWRYRMHVTIEDLKSDAELMHKLHTFLLESGRCSREDLTPK